MLVREIRHGTSETQRRDLHEASQGHLLRKLSLYPFPLRARRSSSPTNMKVALYGVWLHGLLIEVLEFQLEAILFPCSIQAHGIRRLLPISVLVRPKKGLEQVIELGRQLQRKSRLWKIRIIGMVMPGYEAFYQHLRARSEELGVRWELGFSDQSF